MGNEKPYDNKGFASSFCVKKDACLRVPNSEFVIFWDLVWDIKFNSVKLI
jgi:hypothetical protein